MKILNLLSIISVFSATLFLATVAQADFSVSNATSGSIDGGSQDFSVFVSPGNPTTITGLTVDITFQKQSGPCGSPVVDDVYNDEIAYLLISPSGTMVGLIENRDGDANTGGSFTYTDFLTAGGEVTVTFSDAATEFVGSSPGYPISGTFKPEEPLSSFIGEDPSGTWILRAFDSVAEDPVCHDSFALHFKTSETPIPTLSEWGMIVMSVLMAGACLVMFRRRRI